MGNPIIATIVREPRNMPKEISSRLQGLSFPTVEDHDNPDIFLIKESTLLKTLANKDCPQHTLNELTEIFVKQQIDHLAIPANCCRIERLQ